jgi:hypothetical protein
MWSGRVGPGGGQSPDVGAPLPCPIGDQTEPVWEEFSRAKIIPLMFLLGSFFWREWAFVDLADWVGRRLKCWEDGEAEVGIVHYPTRIRRSL